ncbi:MAG TPA: hypothetical protein VFG81_16205 [Anaerolineales bacterium]|jgi:uncharacterized protein YjiK|nr:hypothetical protein [Anaerolineales bacterium]
MKRSSFLYHWAIFFVIIALVTASLPAAQRVYAQSDNSYVYLVREIELAELGVTGLEGLAYSSQADALLAIQSQTQSGTRPVAVIDRTEELRGMSELQGQSFNALNIAFNGKANSLFTLDASTQELTATRVEPDGKLSPSAASSARFNVRMGIQKAQGIDFDPATGRLFILDPAGKHLWVITPDESGNYDASQAQRDNRVKRINLRGIENGKLNGLAYNPNSGNLFTLNETHDTLYEITENGEIVSTRNISAFELNSPAGMVFAPSGDTTDNPETKSLYIADPSANSIAEVSITAVEVMALPPASPISLVNTIFTNTWNPPSPDPSGIDYNNLTNRLVVSDSEVEEMPIYQEKNVFSSTLSGNLQSTCDTTDFTKEPAGLAINPSNGSIFFSNDGKKKLYEVVLGADGQYCTADDQVRVTDMATYGSQDPEGLGFGEGKLFIADGTNAEVWVVSPGPNDFFNGAGSSGDDVVLGHFDTAGIGLRDPEGIDYHPTRGTLFIVSRGDSRLVETTLTGQVVRVFDLGFFNPDEPAGIGIGPGSNNPSTQNIYLVARGLDNNDHPSENDGRIYELNIGDGSGPTVTPIPTTRTPTATPTTPTPPTSDLIFADSFESGNLSAWSLSANGGGDLSVSTAAALVGTRGMQAAINDNTAIYVTDDAPSAESRYRARFYFDPNSISMASGDNHFIFYAISGTSKAVARIQFRFTNRDGYQVRVQVLNNSSSWTNSAWFAISDTPHALEIDWMAAANGGLTLWIDGTQRAALTGIANSNYRIDRVRLGAVNGVDRGTRGTTYFDAFESRRQTFIGP